MTDAGGSAYLIAQDAEGEREISLATGFVWKIGRSDANDIVIVDMRVSREHAVIQRSEAGIYYLLDIGSRNGCFVNERRVTTPAILKDGDRVSIGGYIYEFRSPEQCLEAKSEKDHDSAVTQPDFRQSLVTVLVVDIRDFTRLGQLMEPSVLSDAIGAWFRTASEIMQRHGTWVLKYIGDAIMSTWLHEEDGTVHDDIARVFRALVEFSEATARMEPELGLPAPMRIGAGINTGLASIGNTGTRAVTDYTPLGDAVNAAFRIESATKELGADVLVGSRTFHAMRPWTGAERFFQHHEVHLKGYADPVAVWSASLEDVQAFLDSLPRAESA